MTLGTGWKDGDNSTTIKAARQLLIQDMKIVERIAPESGAYLNEVKGISTPAPSTCLTSFFFSSIGFEI